jgi:peptidoglycan/xylan/chitin deacetylase (PgdA/CDA1 family)
MKPLWLFPFLLVLCIGSAFVQIKIQKTPRSNSHNFSEQSKAETVSLTLNLTDQEKNVRESHPLSLANTQNKYYRDILTNGPRTKREIAMTFDDAPDANFTPKILDILKKNGVKATFFVVGWRVEAYPDIVKRIVAEGHILGNHSYNHANLPKLKDDAFHEQIIKTDRLIEKFTGFTPNIVRPPYGNVTERQVQWLVTQKKVIVNWNVDSLDWKGLKAEEVATNVLTHVHAGSIILQHSGTGTGGDLSGTVKALPKIIDELKNEGFKLVTIPELLGIPSK